MPRVVQSAPPGFARENPGRQPQVGLPRGPHGCIAPLCPARNCRDASAVSARPALRPFQGRSRRRRRRRRRCRRRRRQRRRTIRILPRRSGPVHTPLSRRHVHGRSLAGLPLGINARAGKADTPRAAGREGKRSWGRPIGQVSATSRRG